VGAPYAPQVLYALTLLWGTQRKKLPVCSPPGIFFRLFCGPFSISSNRAIAPSMTVGEEYGQKSTLTG